MCISARKQVWVIVWRSWTEGQSDIFHSNPLLQPHGPPMIWRSACIMNPPSVKWMLHISVYYGLSAGKSREKLLNAAHFVNIFFPAVVANIQCLWGFGGIRNSHQVGQVRRRAAALARGKGTQQHGIWKCEVESKTCCSINARTFPKHNINQQSRLWGFADIFEIKLHLRLHSLLRIWQPRGHQR